MKPLLKLTISCLVASVSQFSHAAYVKNFGGEPFPILENSASNGRVAHFCDPYEREWIGPVADVRAYRQGKNGEVDNQTGTYSAPSYFAIERYNRVETSAFGDRSYSVTLGQAGQVSLSTSEFEDIQQSAHNYLVGLVAVVDAFDIDAELEATLTADIEDFTRSYQNYANMLESTHSVIYHHGTARGQGRWKAGSLYAGYLDVGVVCIPPEVLQADALEQMLKDYIDEVIAASTTATWTSWLDRDNESGSGDYEMRTGFSAGQVCDAPTAIETRIVGGNGTVYIPSDTTPDQLSYFTPAKGLACRNGDQADNRCNDYEVRFLCD